MPSSSGPHNHTTLYSKAYLYDLAFRFKQVAIENDTIIKLFEQINGCRPRSFLDIAAGPATNALDMHTRHGLEVRAIDYSKEMVEYGGELAAKQAVPLHYHQADMRSFELPSPVDIAAMFMASTGYLLTNDDMVSHLQAVSSNLNSKGIYILEMTHPRDVFGIGTSTGQEWEEHHDGCTVRVKWGLPEDPFDPIQQIRHVTACLTYSTATESGVISEQSPQREFTHQEMRALVELSGAFDWVTTLGGWDSSIPCENSSRAWRMIPVLKKRH
jgi:SAM-dependent methyltransferase